MRILGIIPARYGSKGIPQKNIKLLNGKPLIAYTIESALKSELLTRTVVSTDSKEIQGIALSLNADAPFLRPVELAQDCTPSISVVKHSLTYFENNNESFDAVCLLQPTSPFRPIGFIDKCINEFKNRGADSLISVLPVPFEHHPNWTFLENEKRFLKISTGGDCLITRRQELPPAFFRDGSIYIASLDLIKREGKLVGRNIAYILSDPTFYVNIDTWQDWQRAELIVSNLINYL